MNTTNEETMRKAFSTKYPEFSTILMLHEEKSIGVSGIETIVPRHALANFRAGYEAAQALLSQGEPVGHVISEGIERYGAHIKDGLAHGTKLFKAPPSTESLQKDNAELFGKTEQLNKDKAELIEYAKKLRETIEAMATNGWMYCGVEGLDEAQQKVLNALETPQPQCM